jgi:hypothetical protein
VIYISAELFISPRVRAPEIATDRKILRENKGFAPRAAPCGGAKMGHIMPDRRPLDAHFMA